MKKVEIEKSNEVYNGRYKPLGIDGRGKIKLDDIEEVFIFIMRSINKKEATLEIISYYNFKTDEKNQIVKTIKTYCTSYKKMKIDISFIVKYKPE